MCDERKKVEKYWKLMEPNELLSGMFISGVTADVAFYGDCARQQMPRRLKDRAISFNAKKKGERSDCRPIDLNCERPSSNHYLPPFVSAS